MKPITSKTIITVLSTYKIPKLIITQEKAQWAIMIPILVVILQLTDEINSIQVSR